MFEKNSLFFSNEEYKSPSVKFQGEEINILEFPIKYLFESTVQSIEFVHKSIYEYFTAEYIYHSVAESADADGEELACILGKLLNQNILSGEMLEFLDYKLCNSKKSGLHKLISEALHLMLEDGVLYYTKKQYKRISVCEANVITNILKIMQLKSVNLSMDETNAVFSYYIFSQNAQQKFDFSFMDFSRTDFSYKNLCGVNFDGAILNEADFRGANLYKAILSRTHLEKANFLKADLRFADLDRADLNQAVFLWVKLWDAKMYETDLREAVFGYAELKEAKLCEADLSNADFRQSDLRGADLQDARLYETNLSGANLENACIKGATLDTVDVTETKLKGADLSFARFCNMDFEKTDLTGVNIESSFWKKSDVRRSFHKLMDADFAFIYIYRNEPEFPAIKVYRKELFLNTDNWLGEEI